MLNNQNELLQLAIADGKVIVILSLIDRDDLFKEVVEGIMANTQLELISEKKRLESEFDGKKVIFKGLMKEYRDVAKEATFVMVDSERFGLEFGHYKYEGFFAKGIRRKIEKEIKEVVFDVTNTLTVGKLPTRLGMNKFTITGIKNIIIR